MELNEDYHLALRVHDIVEHLTFELLLVDSRGEANSDHEQIPTVSSFELDVVEMLLAIGAIVVRISFRVFLLRKQSTQDSIVVASSQRVPGSYRHVDILKLPDVLLIHSKHLAEVTLDQGIVSLQNHELVDMPFVTVAPASSAEPPLKVFERANVVEDHILGRVVRTNLLNPRERERLSQFDSLLAFAFES